MNMTAANRQGEQDDDVDWDSRVDRWASRDQWRQECVAAETSLDPSDAGRLPSVRRAIALLETVGTMARLENAETPPALRPAGSRIGNPPSRYSPTG